MARHTPVDRAWAYRLTAMGLGLAELFYIWRLVAALTWGHPDFFFSPNLTSATNALVLTFSYLALVVEFVMMLAARLTMYLNAHMADLRDEITIRRQAEERLACEATLDPLTGAANRGKRFEDARRPWPTSVAMEGPWR